MTIGHARIIKATRTSTSPSTIAGVGPSIGGDRARRVPREVIDAKAEADRILREARAAAEDVASEAAREARAKEIARVAAELIALRVTEETKATREIDRTIAIATLLAERIVGEEIATDPSRIGALAVEALKETRGARQIRIEASRADAAALEQILGELGVDIATVEPSDELGRGSLVVHTELGRVDARLEPQLARLAAALREAMIAERRS